MPFAGANRPSIQCGLLKATLQRAGHSVDVHYLNLELAAILGSKWYDTLSTIRTDQLLGEWLFSAAAFGQRGDEDEYQAAYPEFPDLYRRLDTTFEHLRELRNKTLPEWIERWARTIDWSAYVMVGFTSTFEQNVASLALAARIKAAAPGVLTVFGGANYDGEMGPEYVRAFDCIDYAVVGEGDVALPALVAAVAAGEDGSAVAGIVSRKDGEVVANAPGPLVRNLDALPDPDYDEFFAALTRLGRDRVLGMSLPLLPFETARGCWWGEKHHCTFCGLNALGMAYRSKSPDRTHAELRRMSARYQITNFEAVDNILDMRYVSELCEPLIADRYDYRIFYEVKSNLRREQLRTLAHAGVAIIQPGIESLSSHILKLMRKGSSMLLNVRLLRWAHYYGISVTWNMLTGFPGETAEDYHHQAQLIPLLFHLPPPSGVGRVWLERFSPYFTDPEFPVTDVSPSRAYRYIYPESKLDLQRIAYFFSYRMGDVVEEEDLQETLRQIALWQEAWGKRPFPTLVYQRAPDWVQIIDQRDLSDPRVHAFSGLDAAVYESCSDTYRTAAAAAQVVAGADGVTIDTQMISEALERFCELGLMVQEDGKYLSLALPVNPNW